MHGFPQLALGVVATLAAALILVLGSASALQTWQSLHRHRLPPTAAEMRPAPEGAAAAASSYWSGRS